MLNRRKHVSTDVTRSIGYGKALRILARPGFWVICALFFFAATPFDLDQSGAAYLLKAFFTLSIVAYAVLARKARTGKLSMLVIVVVTVLFITNLFGWSDRVLIAMAAIMAGTLLGQARGQKWNDEFRIIVLVYLVVHCIGLLVAVIFFYSAGQVVDLHDAIFPHESRAEAYHLVGRLSGFHNEPGTYSQWMMMALFLFALMHGRLFNKWTAVIALTVVLTVSLWGIIAFSVIGAAFAIETLMSPGKRQRVRQLLSFVLFAGVVIALALSISADVLEQGFQFLEIKGEMATQSGLDKLYAVEFMRQEFWNVVVLGRPFEPGFCPECISPQDAGIGMTGTYYLGFLLFVSLIGIITTRVYARWGIAFVVPILLILVWKAHIYEPLLWIIIGYVLTGPDAHGKRPA